MTTAATGYVPSPNQRMNRLIFDGDDSRYELWEIKFLGHLRLQKLYTVISEPDDSKVDAVRNADCFAELVQCLDDRSLSLIIRLAS